MKRDLHEGWSFCQIDESSQYPPLTAPCVTFPTSVQNELFKTEKIPDIRLRDNEKRIQWIDSHVWLFKTTFIVKPTELDQKYLYLLFQSLDTYCTVYLNGEIILEANNAFRPYRCDIHPYMVRQEQNELALYFHSTLYRGRQLEQIYGKMKCWNGEPSRLYVRKPAYHYSWDWGPKMLVTGPVGSISLHSQQGRILSAFPRATVDQSLKPSLDVSGSIEPPNARVRIFLRDLHGTLLVSKDIAVNGTSFKTNLNVEDKVQLWWPIKRGKQDMYEVETQLIGEEEELQDSVCHRIGFRRVELCQDAVEKQPGSTFYFKINNQSILCLGSNVIPVEMDTTCIEKDHYRRLLTNALECNHNMVRAWAGGPYPPQDFYDLADEMGILIWQDFAFACGQYNVYPSFIQSVEEEARHVVSQYRTHPSLIIMAGNLIALFTQVTKITASRFRPELSASRNLKFQTVFADFLHLKFFPARVIYENTLRNVVREESEGTILYIIGSPSEGKSGSNDPNEGDLHQWEVWGGMHEAYQNYDKLKGRFISEFGFESFPHPDTVATWLCDTQLHKYSPWSKEILQHNKASFGSKLLQLYLTENFIHCHDLRSHIYYTQMLQSEAMSYAYSSWRRDFSAKVGPKQLGGVLVWQLNDVWPVTSWALIDYYNRPKAAYYTVRRQCAPISIGISRKSQDTSTWFMSFNYNRRALAKQVWVNIADLLLKPPTRGIQPFLLFLFSLVLLLFNPLKNKVMRKFPLDETAKTTQHHIEIWGSNSEPTRQDANLWVELFSISTGLLLNQRRTKVQLEANGSTELSSFLIETGGNDCLVSARLVHTSGSTTTARATDWPQPLKHLVFPSSVEAGLRVEKISKTELSISTRRSIKGFILSSESASDNCLDLVPGDDRIITLDNVSRQVSWRHLGSKRDEFLIA